MSNRFAKPGRSSGSLSSILNRSVELAAGKGGPLSSALDAHLHQHPAVREQLSVQQLVANPDQPRRHFSTESLEQLAASVRERGVLQPLMVRPLPTGMYQIVFGERRWRAAQLAGLTSVPVLIRTLSDADVKLISAVENLQREDLNRFDEVQAKLQLVADLFGLSEDQAAARLKHLRTQADDAEVTTHRSKVTALFEQLGGESWVSFVTNGLPVLNLPDFLVEPLRSGAVAYSKALLIARAPEAHQPALLEKVLERDMSITELKQQLQTLTAPAVPHAPAEMVRRLLVPKRLQQLKQRDPRAYQRVERLLTELKSLLDAPADSAE